MAASREANPIHAILKVQLKTVRRSLLDVVIKSLLSMPDKESVRRIDWTKPENRREFEQLWEQKGRPGAYIIYTNAKETGRFLNLKSHCNLKKIISGSQKTVSNDLLGEVIQILHKMPNKDVQPRVDWTKPENRREFEQLWEQKGRPGPKHIFNHARAFGFLGDQEKRVILSTLKMKKQQTISAKLLITLINTLRAMPDRRV